VGIGHPDKVADQISDGILDMYLEQDENARVAAETLVSGNKVIVVGEMTSISNFSDEDFHKTIKNVITNAGYNSNIPCQFREDNLDIQLYLRGQSPNIHQGVDKEGGQIGAGDQGIMFGFATKETDYYLPLPYVISADLLTTLNHHILNGSIPGIYTDNKSQVCCWYQNENIWIDRIILSSFHNKDLSINEVREILKNKIIDPVLKKYEKHIPKKEIDILINSAGPFFIGGPEGDSGLTGRKIIVDTYGGFAPHGGGAFCFSGDTLVKTENGFKEIKNIKPGESVYTYNEKINEIEIKVVLDIFQKDKENSYPLLEVLLENGECLKITENHEVRVKEGEKLRWIKAKDLKEYHDIVDLGNLSTFQKSFLDIN
jgi:S-adenosylmethionine synthetase